MKTRNYTKLLLTAFISTFFINIHTNAAGFESLTSTEKSQKITQPYRISGLKKKDHASYAASSTAVRVELDYWIRWKNQFVWTLPGNGPALLPQKPGC
jgi:hypothetical protein